MRTLLRIATAVLVAFVVAALGLIVAHSIDEGFDRFRDDPAQFAAASEALRAARSHRDHPLQRALAPRGRVVDLRHPLGLCPERPESTVVPWLRATPRSSVGAPPALQPADSKPKTDRDYGARVRFYTFFGLPADDVYVLCGGTSTYSSKPDVWDE